MKLLIAIGECFFYGLQPEWLEKLWRGHCHYEGKVTYKEHFLMNMLYAWELVTGRV